MIVIFKYKFLDWATYLPNSLRVGTILNYASGFIIGYYNIFSQVDIVLCTLETITECGLVVWFFFFIEWYKNEFITWFSWKVFFNRTGYWVEYHARRMGMWVTAKRKSIMMMGNFIWITGNFLCILRYYSIELEISNECWKVFL